MQYNLKSAFLTPFGVFEMGEKKEVFPAIFQPVEIRLKAL
jgi:hypothetical protein